MKKGHIRLSEIPESGEEFQFDLTHRPFSEILQREFNRVEAFSGRFFIQPLNHLFQVTGEIQVTFHETCSRCGDDMTMPWRFSINELIQIAIPQSRRESYSKTNNFSDLESSQSTVTEIPDELLKLPELTYELIAIKTPQQPMCAHSQQDGPPFDTDIGHFDRCAVHGDQPVNFDEEMQNDEENAQSNPFASLKNLLKN